MLQVDLGFLGMKKYDLIIGLLFSFTEADHQMPVTIHRQPEIFQATIALNLNFSCKPYVEFKKTDLPDQFNVHIHMAVGYFEVFMGFKERFSNYKRKIMNSLFQPFEMNNILIFNFQNSAE